jgi:hypothetical protein
VLNEAADNSSFAEVKFIPGHGTTQETSVYNFTDKNLNAGNYSYRLKQIDFDGSFEYSNVVEVDVALPAAYTLEQNHPNPFNPTTNINFSIPVDAEISLKVYTSLGEEIADILSGNFQSGSHQIVFDAGKLSSGIYHYKISAKGIDGSSFSSIKKMMILK